MCERYGLAALSFDGDVDENVTKRLFRVMLHSYPPSRDWSARLNIRYDLEVFEETDLV